jgi:hypothetical protein
MKDTYIKLFIGLLLFATWILLIVFKVPDTGDLIGCIKLALAGLGVYHLGTREGIGGAAPADKSEGRAMPGFLAMLGLGAALSMAGCQTTSNLTPQQATQLTYTQACTAWNAAFSTALQLRVAGKLNKPQIDQITLLDAQVTPICTGPLPTDSTAAAQQVTAAVTTLTILELAKTEQK